MPINALTLQSQKTGGSPGDPHVRHSQLGDFIAIALYLIAGQIPG